MFLKQFIFFIFFVVTIEVSGQDSSVSEAAKQYRSPAISLSYFGEELINPGVKLGLELPLYTRIKEKEESRIRAYSLFTGAQAGYYYHQGNFEALFFVASLGLRHVSPSGFFKDLAVGGGLLKTILPASVYSLSDNGSVIKDEKSGTAYGVIMGNVRLGYDFTHKGSSKIPFSVFAGLSLFNYGTHKFDFFPDYAVEIGGIYKLSSSSRY